MSFQPRHALALSLILGSTTMSAQAALQGRDTDGDASTFEAYYDTALNITWWANAGLRDDTSWSDAKTFATGANLGGVTGWRLPSMAPANGIAFNYAGNYGFDGSKDFGYNIIRPSSELSYMFYVNLGLPGVSANSAIYSPQSAYGDLNPPNDIQQGSLLLSNVGIKTFWYGTAADDGKPSCAVGGQYGGCAWSFSFQLGLQDYGSIDSPDVGPTQASVWLVHDGDVFAQASAVPEPSSIALMLAGLGAVGWASRRRSAG